MLLAKVVGTLVATRKEYTLENWSERYEYPFELALDIKVLVGGKDNVKGIIQIETF